LSARTQARSQAATIGSLRGRVEALRAEAQALLGPLPTWAPDAEKRPGWALEDRAAALEREASALEVEAAQRLHAALNDAPALPEAHEQLAARHRAEHAGRGRVGRGGHRRRRVLAPAPRRAAA